MKTKAQLQRWILLIRYIQDHPYVSFEKLRIELENSMFERGYKNGCSEKTLKRDLRDLRNDFFAEIRYDRNNNGYCIGKSRHSSALLENLIESFELMNMLNIKGKIPDFILPEQHSRGTRYLTPIAGAIQNQKKIAFDLGQPSGRLPERQELLPHALKQFRHHWYLIGKENNNCPFKTFGLNRIENLAITSEPFKTDPTLNMKKKLDYSFSIYPAEEYSIEEVTLAFDPEEHVFPEPALLHSSQKIIERDEKEIIVRLRVRITPDFTSELLSRSKSLRIIAPESLREEMCRIYREALERNSFPFD